MRIYVCFFVINFLVEGCIYDLGFFYWNVDVFNFYIIIGEISC